MFHTVKIIFKLKEQNNDYDPIIVKADKTRINQVLSNLLSNANKSTNIGTEGEAIKFIYVDAKRVKKSKVEKKYHFKLDIIPIIINNNKQKKR